MQSTSIITNALDYINEDIKLVSLVFNITLFSNCSFRTENQSVISLFDKYFDECPRDKVYYYSTTNMRKHRNITKKSFEMLSSWLNPEAPAREDIDLELKDGDVYQDAPKYKFLVSAREKGSIGYEKKNANVISMSFPPDFVGTGKIIPFIEEVCNIFPFQSGIAGYCFECSRYDKQQSETYAYTQAMRYKSIDICRLPHDGIAVGHDGIKGVNWITMLSNEFVTKLGGYNKMKEIMSKEIKIIKVKYGFIIIAGTTPILGDTNKNEDINALMDIFQFVEPLIYITAKRTPSFNLFDDYVEKTESWFMRFSDD